MKSGVVHRLGELFFGVPDDVDTTDVYARGAVLVALTLWGG